MKKYLVILFLAVTFQGFAQTNLITGINISLPTNPDANIAEWSKTMPPIMISAQTRMENGRVSPMVMESSILVSIKGNGVVCGSYTKANAPASNFNSPAKVWSGETALNLLGKACVLKPGNYEFCVQFYGEGAAGQVLIGEACKSFTIKETEHLTYQPPQLLAPANGTVFRESDLIKPMTFRWTPVIPKPQEPVTYRLKVWQLLQGQTGTQAKQVNSPIFTKDVNNITQALVNNIIDGPCKPPIRCDFVWNVQALNREGKPIGENKGMSEDWMFSVQSADVTITNFKVTCGNVYGSYTYTLTAENSGNNPFNTTSITFTSPGGPISGATFTPPSLGTVINPGSANAVTFTGGFNYAGIYPADVYATINGTQLGNTNLPSTDTEVDSIYACICHDCDRALFSFTPSGITPGANSNQYNIAGNISVSGLPAVYGLEIQVQSFSFSAAPSACSNGVTGIEQSGVFLMPATSINGITAIQMFNETASGSSNNNASKTIKLVSTSPFPNSIPVNLTIGLPGPLPGLNADCCKIEYKVCIKVNVFYDKKSCKSCTFFYCFEFNNQ